MASSPRSRRPTLADVAARAGVSTALASIVVRGVPGASPASRQRVLEAVAELGYRPDARARLLRQQRTRLLGVAFGLQHPFHADLVESIYTAAEGAGYDVALSAVAPSRDETRAVGSLLADRCEALVLLGPQLPAAELAELGRRLPVVVVARALGEGAVDVVRTADAAGIGQAVDHLVSLGHERIVHLDGGNAPGAAERRRGFHAAMSRHGLAREARTLPGGLDEGSGADAARILLDEARRPTAVLAFNDACATGVLDVCLRAGVDVPGEVSVVGYDDSHLARLSHVQLTTVGQDVGELAGRAVARVVSRLEDAQEPQPDCVLPPRLVVRATTGPPPSGSAGQGHPAADEGTPWGAAIHRVTRGGVQGTRGVPGPAGEPHE
jgi:DNA-binding LacI/PurR family transcriptional regulator